MRYLPWLIGCMAGVIVYRLTGSIWTGFLWASIIFLVGFSIWYVVHKLRLRRPSSPKPRPATPVETSRSKITPLREMDLSGLNDALTGEMLNPTTTLYQCQHCKVYYYESSVNFLRKENEGKCVACASTDIFALRAAEAAAHGRNYEPRVATLANYEQFANQVVTFEGYVPRINRSRDGKHYAIMFEDKPWAEGFKMVVFDHCVSDAGGETFLQSLLGKTIQVRGLMLRTAYGFEIVVNKRSMILAVR